MFGSAQIYEDSYASSSMAYKGSRSLSYMYIEEGVVQAIGCLKELLKIRACEQEMAY